MVALPSGIVTFLFTDVEGSTRLWEAHPTTMRTAVDKHLALLNDAITSHGGVHFKTVGDAVQAAFRTPDEALAAAVAGQQALTSADWGDISPLWVRIAIHAGSATPVEGDYLAPCLNRLSRLLSIGHGGQTLLTETARRLLGESLPAGVTLRDLGEHRLRDLLEPERIWQVLAPGLPSQFPTLRSFDAHPHNLPIPPTRLIGREAEVTMLQSMLRQEGMKLVTLTGPGGSGKTRLGLEAAAESIDAFPGGAWFVDLAASTDPALLLRQIAAVLGIRESGSQLVLNQLASALDGARTLLILDNLEQFRPFAEMSRTIADLLAAVSGLAVLATSRAPLRLRLEREVPVPPLPTPSPDFHSLAELAASPSVQLFVARAQAARPGFTLTSQNAEVVAALCRRLDGLPLALELAAARIRALSPADILARLSGRLDLLTDRAVDRPDRQRTLEATIAWSHDLLGPDEQAAFRRLAVFSSFTLPAAEAVLRSFPQPTQDSLTCIELLVEQGLLRPEAQRDGSLRYRMLETVRVFALEQLREIGEEETARQAHAAHFAPLALDLEREVRQVPLAVLEKLEPEADNLRSALAWAEGHGNAETGLLLALVFGNLAFQRGQMVEGRTWLERMLPLGGPVPPALRARALVWLGWIALFQGDTDAAETAGEQVIDLAAAEPAIRANALNLLACAAWDRGFASDARQRFTEALAVAGGLPAADRLRASILGNFGEMVATQGNLPEAREYLEAALAALSVGGVSFGRPMLLGNMADLARKEGDQQRSAKIMREALALAHALKNLFIVANELEDAAHHALAIGRPETAARLLGAAGGLRRRVGVPVEPYAVADHEQFLAETENRLGEAAFAKARSEGTTLSLDEAVSEANRLLAEIAGSGDGAAKQVGADATRVAAAEMP